MLPNWASNRLLKSFLFTSKRLKLHSTVNEIRVLKILHLLWPIKVPNSGSCRAPKRNKNDKEMKKSEIKGTKKNWNDAKNVREI